MRATTARLAAALLTASACAGGATDPSITGSVMLLSYQSQPTISQVEAASRFGLGGPLVLKSAHAIGIRTTNTVESLRTLPGVVNVLPLGEDEDPLVSVSILLNRAPGVGDEQFIRGLGAEAVYNLEGWSRISALRLKLSRVPELESMSGVTSMEVYLPGSGPHVG